VGTVPSIWTVGHSNHSFARFAELLRGETIESIVDVRSYPYSRVAPQFNREELAGALDVIGVRYVYLGEALGGRPSSEDDYDEHGHARYDRMAERPDFRTAIERIVSGCRDRRLALMCSEARPTECHRRLLVGKVLAEQGVELRHILSDGVVQQEDSVSLTADDTQTSLFGEETAWRSTRSVSHRRRLSTSSAA
jgi:uncharacterized protein (DUF488 family)